MSDLDEAFDKNYFLNSHDDISRVWCMAGAVNESNHDTSVLHYQQFGFLPSGTLQLYTGDPDHNENIPDIISTHFMIKESGLPNSLNVAFQLHPN